MLPDPINGVPAPRVGHAAAAPGGALHIWSGHISPHDGSNKQWLNDMWRLDIAPERTYMPSESRTMQVWEIPDGTGSLILPLVVSTEADSRRVPDPVTGMADLERARSTIVLRSVSDQLSGELDAVTLAATGDATAAGLPGGAASEWTRARAADVQAQGECVVSVQVWVEMRHACFRDLSISLEGP